MTKVLSSLAEMVRHLYGMKAKRILLITGKASYEKSLVKTLLDEALIDCQVRRFAEFRTNPHYDDVVEGLKVYQDFAPHAIIAVGGGSVVDMAKLLTALGPQNAPLDAALANPQEYLKNKPLPLYALPTTAGTGSEATQFATIWLNSRKWSLDHPWVRPSFAVLDGLLTQDLPADLTAKTGLDALSQAVESYWSVSATEESQAYAARAIPLVMDSLEKAVYEPNCAVRKDMMLAAFFAGQAINITRTTAPHAVSYPLTSSHGAHHGHAVGVLLPSFLRFNAAAEPQDLQDPRGIGYFESMQAQLARLLGAPNMSDAADKVSAFVEKLGIRQTLTQFGVEKRHIPALVQEAVQSSRMLNNPRRVDSEILCNMLLSLIS